MIEYYYKNKSTEHLEQIKEFKKGCWINVVDPSIKEIKFIVSNFGINEANLIDGLDIHENPRFERDESLNYIYLTTPTNKIQHEHDSSFLIIYCKNFFMTISKYSLEIIEKILNPKIVFSKFDNQQNIIKILFSLSKLFENSVYKILKEIKENRADFDSLKTSDIEDLINYEDKLNSYIISFGANIGTYQRILQDKSINFFKKDEAVVEDLIIDLNETFSVCKQTLNTIANMRNYYSTKLSNDLNKNVNALTLVMIFISIPTLISAYTE
jgi:magnesium transporter